MRAICCSLAILLASLMGLPVIAQDKIELEKTTIKGNDELPRYMYVVPWRDKQSKSRLDRKLKLHDLYGDLFDPVRPDYEKTVQTVSKK